MSDGYVSSFRELLSETDWEKYGTGRDPRCADCMVHCGYEPTAVADATASLRNMLEELRLSMRWGKPSKRMDPPELKSPLPVLNAPTFSKTKQSPTQVGSGSGVTSSASSES